MTIRTKFLKENPSTLLEKYFLKDVVNDVFNTLFQDVKKENLEINRKLKPNKIDFVIKIKNLDPISYKKYLNKLEDRSYKLTNKYDISILERITKPRIDPPYLVVEFTLIGKY